MKSPNKPAADNAGISPQLAIGPNWPARGEPECLGATVQNAPRSCSRCKVNSGTLSPLPKVLRVAMRPANLVLPVFRSTDVFCPRCHRAMMTPTIVLLLIAIGGASDYPASLAGHHQVVWPLTQPLQWMNPRASRVESCLVHPASHAARHGAAALAPAFVPCTHTFRDAP